MKGRQASKPSQGEAAFPAFAQLLDGGTITAMQKRWLEAMTKSASTIANAATTIANAQLALLKSLSELQPQVPSADGGAEGIGEAIHTQAQTSRAAIEKTVHQLREVNDVVRECCYEVAGEFESCTRENLSAIEKGVKNGAAPQQGHAAAP